MSVTEKEPGLRSGSKAEKPKKYQVVLVHDTPFASACTVQVLRDVFNKNVDEASHLVLQAAYNRVQTIIVTTAEVAETKRNEGNQELDWHKPHNLFLTRVRFEICPENF